MSLHKRDLTFNFAEKVIEITVFSSDFANFNLNNKVIRTTLDNSVHDIKEIISKRSYDAGGDLNSQCLKLIFKNREMNSYQPLSDFLVQEDHIRVQVDINRSLLAQRITRQTLLNINLKLSNGRNIALREPLESSILSLRQTIAEMLNLENGLADILSLRFNGGVNINISDEALRLGELLQLDIAPLGDLNIYAKLRGDFDCRLICTDESILRSYVASVTLLSSIGMIKDFVLEQYTGSQNMVHKDIKIIYLGRLIKDDTRLYELLSNAPGEGTPLILHLALNEIEENTKTGSFWSEIKKRNFFEFLPRNPNPNYEADVQRDQRLRDQMSPEPLEQTPNTPVLSETGNNLDVTEENSSNDSDELDFVDILPTDQQPVVPELIGQTFQNALVNNEEVYLSEVETSSTVYRVSYNGIQVLLSASQAIINDSDPEQPYLMLTQAGIARLRLLGLPIDIPVVVVKPPTRDSTNDNQIQIMNPFTDVNSVQDTNHSHNFPNQPNGRGAHQSAEPEAEAEAEAAPQPQPEVRLPFNFNIDIEQGINALRLSVESLYSVIRYIIIYTVFIGVIEDPKFKILGTLCLVIYAVTRNSNRQWLNRLLSLFPTTWEQSARRITRAPRGYSSEELKEKFKSFLTIILNTRDGTDNVIGHGVSVILVDLLLLFTSFSPLLHGIFLKVVSERNENRQSEIVPDPLLRAREQHDDDEIETENIDISGQEGQESSQSETQIDEVIDEIDPINSNRATGSSRHEV